MAINTVFETGNFRLDFDSLYGTCWYVRKKDDHVSPLNTGSDAIEEVQWAEELNEKNKQDCTIFNSIAMEHSFEPRWKESTHG